MRLKKHGGLVASLGSRLLGELAELGDGLFLSGLEAGPLGVPVRDLIAADGAVCAAVEIKRSCGYSGGNAFSLNRDHIFLLSQVCKTAAFKGSGFAF